MSEDATTYLALLFSLFVLNRIKGKLPSSTSWATFKRLLSIISATLITSGVFYWRIRGITNCEVGFDTWVIALDISFAHLALTLPLLLAVLSVVTGVGKYGVFLAFPGVAAIDYKGTENKTLWRAIIQVVGYVYLFLITAIALYGVYWVMRFLLIDTMDLQLMLFGAYDDSIGWQHPTMFRFNILYAHIKETVQVLAGNEVLAAIVSFTGLAIAITLGFGSIVRALASIRDSSRPRR